MNSIYSAFDARTNFGEILNLVYYKGKEIVVEKRGKPVAKIVPIKTKEKNMKIDKFKGIWNYNKKIENSMKKFRKDFKLVNK